MFSLYVSYLKKKRNVYIYIYVYIPLSSWILKDPCHIAIIIPSPGSRVPPFRHAPETDAPPVSSVEQVEGVRQAWKHKSFEEENLVVLRAVLRRPVFRGKVGRPILSRKRRFDRWCYEFRSRNSHPEHKDGSMNLGV